MKWYSYRMNRPVCQTHFNRRINMEDRVEAAVTTETSSFQNQINVKLSPQKTTLDNLQFQFRLL